MVLVVLLAAFIVVMIQRHLRFRLWFKQIENAVKVGDIDNLYKLLKGSRYLGTIAKNTSLVNAVLSLFFDNARFAEFLELCELLKSGDQRCVVLSEGVEVLGLDVETIVEDGEVGVREVGIYAVSRSGKGFEYQRGFSAKAIEWLNTFLEFSKPRLAIGHNIAHHDIPLLEKVGVKINIAILDTLTLSLVALPAEPSHSLEYLTKMFGIGYKPHVSSEDARASVELAVHLIGVLKAKGLLEAVARAGHHELVGLEIIDKLFNPEAKYLEHRDKELNINIAADLVVVPRALNSCRGDVWCPKKVPEDIASKLNGLNGAELLAASIMVSAKADGQCDVNKLIESLQLREDLAKAVEELCSKICIEPSAERARIVEARHLDELIKRMAKPYGVAAVMKPYASALLSGRSVEDLIELACKGASEVHLFTMAKHLTVECSKNLRISRLEAKPLKGVKDLRDVSTRNLELIFKYVATLLDDNPCVLAFSIASEHALNKLGCIPLQNVFSLHACKKIVIPTLLDLLIAARNHNLKLHEFVLALRELYNEKEIWLAQGWDRIEEFIEVEPKDLTPTRIEVDVYPYAFRGRREALEVVRNVVKEYWRYELRPYQMRASLHLMQPYISGLGYRKPLTVVTLPTGAGKSLIFQSVALTLNKLIGGVTIVISPLLALIEDQINSLSRRGVDVCRIDSLVPANEKRECIKKALLGLVSLIYMTPEQLQNPEVEEIFRRGDINYVVFDEAHCITKWGYTFRPAYVYAIRVVKKLREEGFWLPVAAFTATLPDEELKRLMNEIGVYEYTVLELDLNTFRLDEQLPTTPRVLNGPTLRDNIEISGEVVKSPETRLENLVETVKKLSQWADGYSNGGSWIGLVFAPFVRSTHEYENAEYIATVLSRHLDEKVVFFHGQMAKEEKERVLEELYRVSRGEGHEPRIVIATKAFGMGVDIPNIRWVVHFMMSESIEDYYQEIGRAGRDGRMSKAILLYVDQYDFERRYSLIVRHALRPAVLRKTWNLVQRTAQTLGSSTVIVPLTLAETYLSPTVKKIYKPRSQEELRTLAEILFEKSLHILRVVDVLDFEVVRGKASPCLDGYPVALDINNNSRVVKLCLGTTKDEYIKISPKTLEVSSNGIRVGGYDKYYIITLLNLSYPVHRLYEELARMVSFDVGKLYASLSLAKRVINNDAASVRELIERYFKLGSEKFIEQELRSALEKVYKWAETKQFRVAIEDNRVTVRRPAVEGVESVLMRTKVKDLNSTAYALGITIALLKNMLVPDLTLVLVPYGYVSYVHEKFKALVEELNIPISSTLKLKSYQPRAYTDETTKDLQKIVRNLDPLAIVVATHKKYLRIADEIKKQFGYRPVVTVILTEP